MSTVTCDFGVLGDVTEVESECPSAEVFLLQLNTRGKRGTPVAARLSHESGATLLIAVSEGVAYACWENEGRNREAFVSNPNDADQKDVVTFGVLGDIPRACTLSLDQLGAIMGFFFETGEASNVDGVMWIAS